MTGGLHYRNAVLAGCPAVSLDKWQFVQNVTVSALTRSSKAASVRLTMACDDVSHRT